MELIVGHRNGEILRLVRNKEKVLGSVLLLPAVVSAAVAVVVGVFASALALGLVFLAAAIVLLVVAIGSIRGAWTPRYAKVEAPGGIAWILDESGVTVNMVDGQARIPWPEVELTRSVAGGLASVRLGGPQASTAYIESSLTHSADAIRAAARDLSGRSDL